MNNKKCLVSFDTDRIKDYLFATPDLKKIRGASTLLDVLNRADLEQLKLVNRGIKDTTRTVIRAICPHINADDIITVGGMAMAMVPEHSASDVITAVESLYRRETVTAGITGTSLPITEDDLKQKFGERVAEVSARLRSAKDQKGQDLFVPLTGWLRPCAACGRHPARPLIEEEGQSELLCHSCQKKDRLGKKARNLFYEGFINFVVKNTGGNRTLWENAFPKDASAIGRASRPPGYLGFIYADGNGMGALLEKISCFKGFRTFARGLDEIVRETTYRALLSHFDKPRQGIAPFEILLMGGDDLVLITAADAALDIALTIVKEFELKANTMAHGKGIGLPEEERLSISAGVVITHDSFPIQAMHALAADLLKKAKGKTGEITARVKWSELPPPNNDAMAATRGTIDFTVVTAAATAGLDVQRNHVLTGKSFSVAPLEEESFTLTERSYSVVDLERLLWHIRRFKSASFPQASLNAMYESLFRSKFQAQLAALTIIARAKPDHRKLALSFFEDFHVLYTMLPWRQRKDRSYSTPLGDLIEIYPFIRGNHGDGE